MNPVTPDPLLGIFLHGVGACFVATCYTPEKRVTRWSCPDLTAVLREAARVNRHAA